MDNSAGYCPRPRNHNADDPAHVRMSFGMMLASPGREDRVWAPGRCCIGAFGHGGGGFVRCYPQVESDSVQSGPYARLTPRTKANYP